MTNDQAKSLKYIFEENQFCSHFLIERDFEGLLEQNLQEAQPIADSFWQRFDYVEDFRRVQNHMPSLALQIIEKHSPVLLNQDLASIALMRLGKMTRVREERVAAMISYEEEFPEKYFEAVFALTHWRNWNRRASKWLNWEVFFDLIDLSLKDDRYKTWGAYSFIWALVQNGGNLSINDPDYNDLLIHFKELLKQGLNSQDEELQVACAICLGKLRDWKQSKTVSDQLSSLT